MSTPKGNLDPHAAQLGQVYDLKPYGPDALYDIELKLARRGLELKRMPGGLASIGLRPEGKSVS